MKDPWIAERLVADLGARNDGILSTKDLEVLGVSPQALTRLRRRGVVVSIGKGVDRLRDHPFDLRSRSRAAVTLAGPGAVLGLRSAARLHGCWAYRDSDAVEVLGPRGRDHRLVVGRLIETRRLPDRHVTAVDGLPVATLARTFFDLCGDPDDGLGLRHPVHERRMKQLYNDCLARRGLTFAKETAVLVSLARRGRRGTRLVRSLLEHYGPGHVPSHSDVETLFDELLRSHGLPEPERQAVIVGPRGFIGTVDCAWRAQKLVVEVDSRWHDGPEEVVADAARDSALREAGFAVKRYRYRQIVLRPTAVTRELAAILSG